MNDNIMKAKYIKPQTLIIEMECTSIICLSGGFNDPYIFPRGFDED